jgi:hypothetical protein
VYAFADRRRQKPVIDALLHRVIQLAVRINIADGEAACFNAIGQYLLTLSGKK